MGFKIIIEILYFLLAFIIYLTFNAVISFQLYSWLSKWIFNRALVFSLKVVGLNLFIGNNCMIEISCFVVLIRFIIGFKLSRKLLLRGNLMFWYLKIYAGLMFDRCFWTYSSCFAANYVLISRKIMDDEIEMKN